MVPVTGESRIQLDLASKERISKTAVVSSRLAVSLLTGGSDRHYAYGLATALAANGVFVDVIGSDQDDSPEMHSTPNLNFLNLHGKIAGGLGKRIWLVAAVYYRLFHYAATAKPKIFHILWNNKFELFDRTVLMMYYKLLNKKIVFTAHNVNSAVRDLRDSPINRLTLRIQYKLSDHIFVHTPKMKNDLIAQFPVSPQSVSVIPFGINNAIPNSEISCAEAKQSLDIKPDDRTILFFGAIKQYKGLEYLVDAFGKLAAKDPRYRLIIAGETKKGHERYWRDIEAKIGASSFSRRITQVIKFIPDRELELFFKAADVTVLSYTEIFQSGILFLAYSFGLPVIASDVGSFRQDIVEGQTGFICRPNDSGDLADAIERYFQSEIFRNLDVRRNEIREHANRQNSWRHVADITKRVYASLEWQ